MNGRVGEKRAFPRSSILFLVGLFLTGFAATGAGPLDLIQAGRAQLRIENPGVILPANVAPRSLTGDDLAAAKTAWAYFEANTQTSTGFVNSTDGFPSTTMWDQASYVMALVSAARIGIIEPDEFAFRAEKFLTTLAGLALCDDRLPNKAYDTTTLAMVDYGNTPVEGGIGWSALDLSRLLLALRVLEHSLPEAAPKVRAAIARWDISAMTSDGMLIGASRADGVTTLVQEGRLGYEQYAARAAALWGLDVSAAIQVALHADWRDVAGTPVPVDRRTHTIFEASTPTLSEPYMLQGLELGFDPQGAIMAAAVYQAQEARFDETGILTMVSEDHIDQAPWFLFASVYSDGKEWAVLSDQGEPFPELRAISLKAAFAWNALYGTDYTDAVKRNLTSRLAIPGKGWAAGVYEATGQPNGAIALNTNAVVLESLHYTAFGPLLPPPGRTTGGMETKDIDPQRAATERR